MLVCGAVLLLTNEITNYNRLLFFAHDFASLCIAVANSAFTKSFAINTRSYPRVSHLICEVLKSLLRGRSVNVLVSGHEIAFINDK